MLPYVKYVIKNIKYVAIGTGNKIGKNIAHYLNE